MIYSITLRFRISFATHFSMYSSSFPVNDPFILIMKPSSSSFLSQYFTLLFLLVQTRLPAIHAQQSQANPLTWHGGAILAMSGRNCVAMAVDHRFGQGPVLIQTRPRPVLTISNQCMLACTGLSGHVQALHHIILAQLSKHISATSTTKSKTVTPNAVITLLSHLLYQQYTSSGQPFAVEPIVVALHPHTQEPFLCSMDSIGALSRAAHVVAAGPSATLLGVAEALWRPHLEPEELVQVLVRAFVSALERDCLSGYGATIYLMTPSEGILEYPVCMRND
jgi:20S proteasome subunit beta 3